MFMSMLCSHIHCCDSIQPHMGVCVTEQCQRYGRFLILTRIFEEKAHRIEQATADPVHLSRFGVVVTLMTLHSISDGCGASTQVISVSYRAHRQFISSSFSSARRNQSEMPTVSRSRMAKSPRLIKLYCLVDSMCPIDLNLNFQQAGRCTHYSSMSLFADRHHCIAMGQLHYAFPGPSCAGLLALFLSSSLLQAAVIYLFAA